MTCFCLAGGGSTRDEFTLALGWLLATDCALSSGAWTIIEKRPSV